MATKSSHGYSDNTTLRSHCTTTDDSLNASMGALLAAETILAVSGPSVIKFTPTGTKRNIKPGDLYILSGNVYVATFDGDVFEIADVELVQ